MTEAKWRVEGQIIEQDTKVGQSGLKVEAWDRDIVQIGWLASATKSPGSIDDLLGHSTTDADGKFVIEFHAKAFEASIFKPIPALYFKVFSGDRLIKNTRNNVLLAKRGTIPVTLSINLDEPQIPEETWSALGLVKFSNGKPAKNYSVVAWDEGPEGKKQIGQSNTDDDGFYQINYKNAQLTDPQKKYADLIVTVFDTEVADKELASSGLFSPAPHDAKVDLLIDLEQSSTKVAARLAGFSEDTTEKIAKVAPEVGTLTDETVSGLIDNGIITDADATRLVLATISLDIANKDALMAGKVLTELENLKVETPSDLLNLSREDIKNIVESTELASDDESMEYATQLRNAFIDAFPNETLSPAQIPLSIKVHTANGPVTVSPATISQIWENNPTIDLRTVDISKDSTDWEKLNLSRVSTTERTAFMRDIQARNGVLLAAGNASLAKKMLAAGIVSPSAVSPQNLAAKLRIPLSRAVNIHNRDVLRHGRLSHGMFALIDAYSGGLQKTAVGNIRPVKVFDFVSQSETNRIFDGLDSIQELFGDMDSCDCQHCNSILSPSAYFVDLMYFIQEHVLSQEPLVDNQNHPLHLKNRRPDLWNLKLTCENTHNEISQLQITNSIFEEYIYANNTTEETSTLGIEDVVYGEVLSKEQSSLLQPFFLPLEELEIYLGHFGISRGDIAEMCEGTDDVFLRAVLGVTSSQAGLIAEQLVGNALENRVKAIFGDSIATDDPIPMRKLLDATQLSRQELGEFLQSKILSSEGVITIVPRKKSKESVQFDIELVGGVKYEHLGLLHRILRLRRFVPWLPKELDAFISSAGGYLNADFLRDVGRAVWLKKRFNGSAQELCALAGILPDFPIIRRKRPGERELNPYDILFNIPDLMHDDQSYPNDSYIYNSALTESAEKERAMRLRAGLGLNESDLTTLIQGLSHTWAEGTPEDDSANLTHLFRLRLRSSPRPKFPEADQVQLSGLPDLQEDTNVVFPLTADNLSLLYRHVVLARWLKLSIADLLTLIRLALRNVNHISNLEETLNVVQFYDLWKSARLSIEDLIFLFAEDALDLQIQDLYDSLRAWLSNRDFLTVADTFFVQINGISEKQSRELIESNTNAVFEKIDERYHIKADSDDIAIPPEMQDYSEAIEALVQYYHPQESLPRAITKALEIDIVVARAIASEALSESDGLSVADFKKENGLLSEGLAKALVTILKLHRLLKVLQFAPNTLDFVIKNKDKFGVLKWYSLSTESIFRTIRLQDILKQRYRNDPTPALEHLQSFFHSNADLTQTCVLLHGLDPILTRDIVETYFDKPTNNVDALLNVERLASTANKIGIDATVFPGILSDDYQLARSASKAIIAGFRSKYPNETEWKPRIEPYQERVLEKKRDALIDYLLRGPQELFPDVQEMYKYFLIDPEVDGDFRTSKVVAANSSLQLYIHRIRMNLEKDSNDGLHVLPSLIHDEEWEWRQHYRMWEANRKIFLWPENYLDPTIRDDKTPLFEKLESELLQQEITKQTVIDAYANYLKDLNDLASLRYAGAYHHYIEDRESEEISDILYLFGATGGDSPTHYWRELRNLAKSQEDELVSPEYGPWLEVETRIPTRHVSPVVFNGRLWVFWNEITSSPRNAVNDGKSRFIGYSHRYELKFTSLRMDGHWTPAESVSLLSSAPTFEETNNIIDDPLADGAEAEDFVKLLFGNDNNLYYGFGVFSAFNRIDEALTGSGLLSPRWSPLKQTSAPGNLQYDVHTKAREGYTVKGFMWERPYIEPSPAFGRFLPINCAGLLVRGCVDLFDRAIIRSEDTDYFNSDKAGLNLIARRKTINSHYVLLRRKDDKLSQCAWYTCPYDYQVASSIALNSNELSVFKRHALDPEPSWSSDLTIATVGDNARMWSVAGTLRETVIETDEELYLLLPSAKEDIGYKLHRLGTTLVPRLSEELFLNGVDGLLATKFQTDLAEPEPSINGPYTDDLTVRNPIANEAPFGTYYQEIFQHIPLLLAHHLNAQGKFEGAQRWYHYVFDPTSSESINDSESALKTDRNWRYRQFRGHEHTKLREILKDKAALEKYNKDPFNVHAIARLRVSAYQKAIVMRYIDNLLDWADELFTRFQMETVNEAMMLYVTAAEILGPKPLQLGDCGELIGSERTYNSLKEDISEDGEILLEVEELIFTPQPEPPRKFGPVLKKPFFGLEGILAVPQNITKYAVGLPDPVIVPGITVPVGPVIINQPIIRPSTYSSPGYGTTSLASSDSKSAGIATASQPQYADSRAAIESTSTVVAKTTTARSLISNSAVSSNLAKGLALTSKAVVPLPITNTLANTFLLKQQFQFLGSQWKNNAGLRILPTLGARFARAMVRQVVAAFCIPRNEMLEGYWDRVEDRVEKIRSGRDITGRKRKLALFAPPIDPMLLARARAAGLSLDDALSAVEGIVPRYRFSYLLQKAKEYAGTVLSFGSALQTALERKDSEELVRLQTTQQQNILAMTTRAKEWELENSRANLEATERRKVAVENRHAYYNGLIEGGLNEWETAEAVSTHAASALNASAATLEFLSGVLHLIPQGGSPFAMTYGGVQTGTGMERLHGGMGMLARVAHSVAASASLEGRNDRRREEWKFQRDQSTDELSQIEKQIEAATIARDLAEHSLTLHKKNIEQNEELLDYHEGKFSSLGLFDWLASQLQRTYREAYNVAYQMARYAEQAYRFEREDYSSELLSTQYWETARAGLLAGNRLTLDLESLEQRYIETDTPKREITDHFFSLRQWDAEALIRLRQTGQCSFSIPELFFDLASPGDYRRRLRSVRITIPAVSGPYDNVMATVSLDSSKMRYEAKQTASLIEAPRPRIESISTSSSRNDAGAFELNFGGEKYVPFEGAGAISTWKLSLPNSVRAFDYDTIGDVILHLDYTASFDGVFRDSVQKEINDTTNWVQDRLANNGIVRVFNLKEEFPYEYKMLISGGAAKIEIHKNLLPVFLKGVPTADSALVFAGLPEDYKFGTVTVDAAEKGTPDLDTETGLFSLSLDVFGNLPWSSDLKTGELPGSIQIYLSLQFGSITTT